ncbi:unnamed protein product [Symbiodinium natans]|uniref:Peptidase M14 domain-containing protein n=1 Tax=Symbiodinium natans TaxID=878477 RepID=A0A812RPS4_9DINO|nr:unnamed protein product [Symbiodinium natans]
MRRFLLTSRKPLQQRALSLGLVCALGGTLHFGARGVAMAQFYPIGKPGVPWGPTERTEWLAKQSIKRSYHEEVLSKIEKLRQAGDFEVFQYGALSYDTEKYPLFALKTPGFGKTGKPVVLVTGGVHGYETSGVQGALRFLETEAKEYADEFDILVAPCVSPWGYETINRWNPNAVDPNRSFKKDSDSEEAAAIMKLVSGIESPVLLHMDLHETTDTDESEFRPARAARDGKETYVPDAVPDGFYTVGDTENPQTEFQAAIIASVRKVTHIAPPDAKGCIIGEPVAQEGVINYPIKSLGLCSGVTGAKFVSTTEVYPDSPKVTDAVCNEGQVAAVTGALEFVKQGLRAKVAKVQA